MTTAPIANIDVHSAETLAQCVILMEAALSLSEATKTMDAMIATMKVGKRFMEAKTMTVEERARECAKEYERLVIGRVGDAERTSTWDEDGKWVHATITTLVAQALRDQIKECAGVADYYCKDGEIRYANCIAEQIRALAEPTEERKEIER